MWSNKCSYYFIPGLVLKFFIALCLLSFIYISIFIFLFVVSLMYFFIFLASKLTIVVTWIKRKWARSLAWMYWEIYVKYLFFNHRTLFHFPFIFSFARIIDKSSRNFLRFTLLVILNFYLLFCIHLKVLQFWKIFKYHSKYKSLIAVAFIRLLLQWNLA